MSESRERGVSFSNKRGDIKTSSGEKRKKPPYKRIAVLGVGSLGGFFADSIASVEGVEEIIIIDHDVVKQKNLKNSIYTRGDVGKKKVDALKEVIQRTNSSIKIVHTDQKFLEKKSKISECDLVFDCRDYTYNRYGLVDSRLYISGRYLIIDCRRFVKHKYHYEGAYTELLTRKDLAIAAMAAARMIKDNFISKLIQKQTIYKYDLDSTHYQVSLSKDEADVAIDKQHNGERITDLMDNFYSIMTENRKKPVRLQLNSFEKPTITKDVPKGQLRCYRDVVNSLLPLIDSPFNYFDYTIELKKKSNKVFVVLLPDTGGS